jgi:hypothetical protein
MRPDVPRPRVDEEGLKKEEDAPSRLALQALRRVEELPERKGVSVLRRERHPACVSRLAREVNRVRDVIGKRLEGVVRLAGQDRAGEVRARAEKRPERPARTHLFTEVRPGFRDAGDDPDTEDGRKHGPESEPEKAARCRPGRWRGWRAFLLDPQERQDEDEEKSDMPEVPGINDEEERVEAERRAGRREDPARAHGETRREEEEDGDIEDGRRVKRRHEKTAAGSREQRAQGVGGGRQPAGGRDFWARERRPRREEQPQRGRRDRERGARDPSRPLAAPQLVDAPDEREGYREEGRVRVRVRKQHETQREE